MHFLWGQTNFYHSVDWVFDIFPYRGRKINLNSKDANCSFKILDKPQLKTQTATGLKIDGTLVISIPKVIPPQKFPGLHLKYHSVVVVVLREPGRPHQWLISLWRPRAEKKCKDTAHAKSIPHLSNKKPILSFSPRCDQLPKQTGAVMNVINMIDGISGAADLTPRARVQGAGAAKIYSPPSHDILLSHTKTLSPAGTQPHYRASTAPCCSRGISDTQA